MHFLLCLCKYINFNYDFTEVCSRSTILQYDSDNGLANDGLVYQHICMSLSLNELMGRVDLIEPNGIITWGCTVTHGEQVGMYILMWNVDWCWHQLVLHLNVILGNTLRLRPDGCCFADDILKCIFLYENICILIAIKISQKFVPKGPINNIPALF